MSTSYMKDIKKWAKHIIRRFGKKKAMIYVSKDGSCPCLVLGKKCNKCWRTIFKKTKDKPEGLGCKAAGEFYRIWRDNYYFIPNMKRIIRGLLQ